MFFLPIQAVGNAAVVAALAATNEEVALASTSVITKGQAAQVTVQHVSQMQRIQQKTRNVMRVASIARNPLGHAVVYVTKHGLKVTDPILQKYLGFQIAGNTGALSLLADGLKRRIDRFWPLPMRYERMQLATLNELLDEQITGILAALKEGTTAEARAAMRELEGECQLHALRSQIGLIEPKISDAYVQVARDLASQRPDYKEIMASPNSTEAELAQQQELERPQVTQAIFQAILPQGMQNEIIETLEKNTNHTAVAQQLDTKVQEVLRQAQEHNLLIHPELDWRLQSALKALPESVNAKDFTFNLATVEHLVNDIQLQSASSEQATLIERSPELLAQAVSKYFEYLAPTETELALVVDLARYVSDVTTGTEYLSAEVREQRIAQFWKAIDSLSFDNLSQVTAEQVIDSAAYFAARATYVVGARAAIAVIKNLKYVGAAAPRAAALFAERFVKVFDSVISTNPVLITNEGAVVWNASGEAAAEARQLVQAFDGMKNKPPGSKPLKILDDTDKVVKNEAKLESKSVGDLIKDAKPGEVKRYARIYEKPGDYSEALKDFELLGPSDVKPMPGDKVGKIGKLADGRTAIVREYSKGKMGEPSGPPTLEIQADSSKIIKFRYRD